MILQKLVYVPPSEVEEVQEEGDARGKRSLLDAVDLDAVLKATRPALAVDEVPGGAVSFLFERTSEAAAEPEEGGREGADAEDGG